MKANLFRIFFLLMGLFLNMSCTIDNIHERGETRYMIGDQEEWAATHFDDRLWKKEINIEGGEIFWARTVIDIKKAPAPLTTYGMQFNSFGEYEVYWDGQLVGRNGNPGKEAVSEPSGRMWAIFAIPKELTTEGKHVLAIRKSLLYYPKHAYGFKIWLHDFEYLVKFPLINTAFMHIFAGAFLLAALYFFFLYLGNKKEYPVLIFGGSCFLFFALIIMEFIRTYIPIHYSQHHIRLEIIGFLTFFIAILVPLYFTLQFPYPKQKNIFIAYLVVLLIVFWVDHTSYDYTAYQLGICMWVFSLGIVLFGIYRKQKGSFIVLLALLLCWLINSITHYDTSLFAGFGVIVLGMFYILSVKTKDQRVAYEKSLLQSTRLRLALLKKNIQPHFIMNSLTSLMDWVEESPKKGVEFIEALAAEFDLLNQIENKTLIPIHQEIALCKTHLEVMEYRKEITYTWEEEGIQEEEEIPPAILHTLLENGVTHCTPLADNRIGFKLLYEEHNTHICYTFLTIAKVRNPLKKIKEGTGIRYIKARLKESYGTNWHFSSEAVSEGWKNKICINR
ncbi:histidine kinase [Aquimarina sp. TRL1]|uniref:histidine kinase n=1 Tax=Aquimarina sp. (strain TRL1) TaxID=2736252 RepID=UPI001589CF45|nr:sensor histidine kinase [Aquimarina sp. TRL1]QKX07125.1 histidine kinase [Aquimarina sp. TRL1]